MNKIDRIQEWLANRLTFVQFPKIRRDTPIYSGAARTPQIPRGLPQTRIGVYLSMFLLFGWSVVLLCVAIPVLYCIFWLFAAIFGFI